MTTRLKTIEFAVPTLTTLANDTPTAMSAITLYIPEWSGTVTFRKVVVECTALEGAGAVTTGPDTVREVDVSVGGATATAYVNPSDLARAGSINTCVLWACDCTDHFVTNWTSGTSKSLALTVTLTGPTGTAWVNICATIYITYEYDDTQATQIKTVYIPLAAPQNNNLATSKPGSANDTIPILDASGGILPEGGTRYYRNMFIVLQGNLEYSGTTDLAIHQQINSYTQQDTQTLEMASGSDYWLRFVWDLASISMDTSSSQGWYIWADYACLPRAQAWLVVTYEFDASASNDMLVSLLIPFGCRGPVTSNTSGDYQTWSIDLWIEENGLTTRNLACVTMWSGASDDATTYSRLGTGSFVSGIAGSGTTVAGDMGCMVRNDSAYTLARGKNTLAMQMYKLADSAVFQVRGFFIVNYTCDKPTSGYGAANHTVKWNTGRAMMSAGGNSETVSLAVTIPESNYFFNAVSVWGYHEEYTVLGADGTIITVERLSGEGVQIRHDVGHDLGNADAAEGCRFVGSHYPLALFQQFPNDARLYRDGRARLDIETSRSWNFMTIPSAQPLYDLWITYHTITFTAAGAISGFSGTVSLSLQDANGVTLLKDSRSGDGSFSFTTYDNVYNLRVLADDGTNKGCSDAQVASGSP